MSFDANGTYTPPIRRKKINILENPEISAKFTIIVTTPYETYEISGSAEELMDFTSDLSSIDELKLHQTFNMIGQVTKIEKDQKAKRPSIADSRWSEIIEEIDEPNLKG